MDISEEVRAAHKREFADFLDQDVCRYLFPPLSVSLCVCAIFRCSETAIFHWVRLGKGYTWTRSKPWSTSSAVVSSSICPISIASAIWVTGQPLVWFPRKWQKIERAYVVKLKFCSKLNFCFSFGILVYFCFLGSKRSWLELSPLWY